MSEVASPLRAEAPLHVCPWCTELLREPHSLSCGHAFCKECLLQIFSFRVLQSFEICTSRIEIPTDPDSASEEPDSSDNGARTHYCLQQVDCPVCKKATPVPDSPEGVTSPADFVASLAYDESFAAACDKVRAERESKQCGWCEERLGSEECAKCEVIFCADCKAQTHSRAAFQSHEFYSVTEAEQHRTKTCAKHKGRRKDLYCRDCSRSVCLYCTQFESEHKDHQLCSFEEANSDFRKEIAQITTRYEYVHRDMNTFQQSVQNTVAQLRDGATAEEERIHQAFERAQSLLRQQEDKFLKFLRTRTQGDVSLGNTILKCIGHIEQAASAVMDRAPQNTTDPAHLVQHKKQLTRLLLNLEDMQMETSLFPVRFDFDDNVFSKSLQAACNLAEELDMNEIDSAIATETSQREKIVSWLSKVLNGRKQCHLVYRASHNGWSDQKFQEIADKISDPVLLIAKTEDGHIFGGYQSTTWKRTNSFAGADSFLFALANGTEGSESVFVDNCQDEDMKQLQYSPKDLRFSLGSKAAASQLGNSYRVPATHPEQASTLLLGGPQAALVEVELFCLGTTQSNGPKVQAILRGKPQLKQALAQLIQHQYQPSNLLYKASRDGWFASTFHELCDDVGPTLLLAKSEYGHIFGGYAHQDWGGRHIQFKGYIQDSRAVLFSLTDGQNRAPALLKLRNPKMALQNDYKRGPCFGGGNDVGILLEEQRVQCNPHSYVIPSGFRQDTYLAGQASARLDEVEVYSVPE